MNIELWQHLFENFLFRQKIKFFHFTLPSAKPEITFLKEEDDYAEFRLENCDISLANALRRVMMAEVPIVAIESVEVSWKAIFNLNYR